VTDPVGSPEHIVVAPPSPDRPEFERVYREQFSFVYRVLRYLGARDPDAEDLAHDVFVVVHRRLADYDPARPIRPWLFGIAYRVVRRHREHLGSRGVVVDEPREVPAEQRGADDQLVAAEAWARVERALQTLPLEQRAVLILHDIEEYTAPEIAADLDVPLNTIYSRLRLARDRFAAALQRPRRAGGNR